MSKQQIQGEDTTADSGGKADTRVLQRDGHQSGESHAISEIRSNVISVDWEPAAGGSSSVRRERSPAVLKGDSSSKREPTPQYHGHQDQRKRVTLLSSHSDSSNPDDDRHGHGHFRKSDLLRNRASRRHTEIVYDIVVEKETDPEFVADLHDLTKEKYDARDFLVQETPSVITEKRDDKKKQLRYVAPWRRQEKTASRAKLVDEKMGDQTRFGVRIGKKIWVPTIANPLEIDLRKSQKKELKEVFEMIENPRAGMVATDDIGAVVGACGSEPTPALIDDIVKKIEPLHPGFLTFEEFEDILRCRLQEQDPIEEIARTFKMMTRHRTDRVGLEDLREVSKLVDYPVTDDELMEMINAASPTGSGEVTLSGFVRLMTSPTWYDVPKATKRRKDKMSAFKQDRVYRQVTPPRNK